jgi:hypothetical protein
LIEVHFPPLSRTEVAEVLRGRGFDEAQAHRGVRLGGGSVARAIAVIERDEESLRDNVARWFLEVARGETPVRPWASRETLGDGLDTILALARDWVVAANQSCAEIPRAAEDYAPEIAALPPLGAVRAAELLTKLDDAARLAGTNVPATMVAESVRMAISAAAGGGER